MIFSNESKPCPLSLLHLLPRPGHLFPESCIPIACQSMCQSFPFSPLPTGPTSLLANRCSMFLPTPSRSLGSCQPPSWSPLGKMQSHSVPSPMSWLHQYLLSYSQRRQELKNHPASSFSGFVAIPAALFYLSLIVPSPSYFLSTDSFDHTVWARLHHQQSSASLPRHQLLMSWSS